MYKSTSVNFFVVTDYGLLSRHLIPFYCFFIEIFIALLYVLVKPLSSSPQLCPTTSLPQSPLCATCVCTGIGPSARACHSAACVCTGIGPSAGAWAPLVHFGNFWLAWSCAGLVHADAVAVSSCVQWPCGRQFIFKEKHTFCWAYSFTVAVLLKFLELQRLGMEHFAAD